MNPIYGRRARWGYFRYIVHGVALPVTLFCGACAHYEPRYTPESVAPPPSIEAAREQITAEISPAAASPAVESPGALSKEPINITLENAIQMALQRNRSLEVQSYNPEIAEKAIAEARAAFDPALSISANYSNEKSPSASASTSTSTASSGGSSSGTGTGSSTSENVLAVFQTLLQETQAIQKVIQAQETVVNHSNNFNTSAKISQPLPSGTEIYVESGYQRSDSSQSTAPQYTGDWTVGISQALLRGFGNDVNLVSLRTARNNTAISELAFRDFTMQIVGQVESAYWDLALAQETLRIQQFALELAQEQLKLNEAMIAVGKLSGTARVSAEAEVAAQKASLVDAQADLMKCSITLWKLLNPDQQTPESLQFLPILLPEETAQTPALSESIALARCFRPDLAQAKLDLENGDLALVQTKNGLLPQLDAFVSYGENSTGTNSGDWSRHLDDDAYGAFQAGLNFSMTLGNRAEKARHQRAKLQRNQAEAAVRNLEQTIEAEIRQAIVEVSRQTEQIAASEQEVRNRKEELDVETEQFRLGRSTNLDVLQIQQKYIQSKVQEVTAHVRYQQALSSLYEKEGTLLTRHAIVTDKNMGDVL